MIKYVLNYYDGLGDDGICFEHDDENTVTQEALRRSSTDQGKYTYRLERWENERIAYKGSRYFQDGRELTSDIVNTLMDEVLR